MGYVSLITLIVRIQGTQRSRYLGEYTVTQLYSMVQQIMVSIRGEKTWGNTGCGIHNRWVLLTHQIIE